VSKKTQKYLINGAICPGASANFLSRNRAFRLGDGFFETLKVVDRKMPFWNAHMARMEAACKLFGMEIPETMSPDFLLKSVQSLIEENGLESGGRLRITVFREGGGAYAPETDQAGYVAELTPHYPNHFVLDDRGASLEIFRKAYKIPDAYARFKVMGNRLSIDAARYSKSKGCDEAVLINADGRFVETTSGNLFTVKNGRIKTPSLKEGGVAGVMRMAIINLCLDLGVPIFEGELGEKDLLQADEVFFTNAIAGIKWVAGFREKRYFHNMSGKLVSEMNRRISGKVEV